MDKLRNEALYTIARTLGLSVYDVESLEAAILVQLEAQHRKTWALAMEHHSSAARTAMIADLRADEFTCSICADAVRATPCPPIEATKDK